MNLLQGIKNRYYIPSAEDGTFISIFRRLTSRSVPAFPRTVQIQTMTGCNAACIFCPYPLTVNTQPKGRMDDVLFKQIIDEMAHHGVRRISPYLMNEPFLDEALIDRLTIIKEIIPSAKVVVTTNGSRITHEKADELINHPYIHALYISFQGIEKEGYESTMKGSLKFEETLERVNYLIGRWKQSGGKKLFKIVVTMVSTNKIDPEKAVKYWRAVGVESKFTALENRGGNIEIAGSLSRDGMKRFANCTRLFKQAYIMFNGDMVLCCTDYTRKVVLGNIAGSSIQAVWNGKKANAVRRLYAEGNMDKILLCKNCEIAYTTGEEEFD